MNFRRSIIATTAFAILLAVNTPVFAAGARREEPRQVRDVISKIVRIIRHLVPTINDDGIVPPKP